MVKFGAPVVVGVVKRTIYTRPHHVQRLQPWKGLRGFQSDSTVGDAPTSKAPLSATQRPVDAATRSLPEPKEEDVSLLPTGQLLHLLGSRHFSIYARFPNLVSPEDVIEELNFFKIQKAYWQAQQISNKGRQALVILATPSFASWLDHNSGFIPTVLQKLTEKIEYKFVDHCEVDVVCACVDGISPTPPRTALKTGKKHQPSPEGFSFLHGLSEHIIGTAWAEEGPDSSPVLTQGSLTFTGLTAPAFTVPLANTLFKTGKISTLGVSRWKACEKAFINVREIPDKKNITINVFSKRMQAPTLQIPATPLTPARRIINGLGNIVRTIDFGEGGIGPASRELELMVNEYLVAKRRPQSTIDVWALVIPREAVSESAKRSAADLMLDINDVKTKWGNYAEPEHEYMRYWIRKGATLCRVLSGGGGWGAKQGLLSLDPQTTYNTINEGRFDFTDASLEEQQSSALGNIAQEGASIQFFVAKKNMKIAKDLVGHDRRFIKKTFVLGGVPSTVDDVPETKQEYLEKNLFFLQGHFGCVSESGIYFRDMSLKSRSGDENISTEPKAVPHQTKIDLPYSWVCCDTLLEEKARSWKGIPTTKLFKRFESEVKFRRVKLEDNWGNAGKKMPL